MNWRASLGLLLVVSAAYARVGAQSPTDARLLTLGEAVARALESSDRALAARDVQTRALLALELARSTFQPQVASNVLGTFGQSDISNQSYGVGLLQRLPTGTEVRANVGALTSQNQLGTFYSSDMTFAIAQPLLRGFGRTLARRPLESAEVQVRDAARQREQAEQRIALDVAAAYYQIAGNVQLLDSAERAAGRARELLAASTAKLAIGRVSRLDVLRAEQLVGQAETQVLDATAALDDAKDLLRELMNRGPEFAFAVSPDVSPPAAAPPVDEVIRLALANRVELQSSDEGLREAERAHAAARNAQLPQLDLNLALTRREAADTFRSSFGLDRFRVATFAALSVPFDRTPQSVTEQQAAIDVAQRRRERDALRRAIALEARRAVRRHERLRRSLELADGGVDLAARETELASLRFQRGLANNLDVVNAEANLLGAGNRRVAVLADLALSRLQLSAVTGMLDPRSHAW